MQHPPQGIPSFPAGLGVPGELEESPPHTASEGRFTAQMYGHGHARNKELCPTLGQDSCQLGKATPAMVQKCASLD